MCEEKCAKETEELTVARGHTIAFSQMALKVRHRRAIQRVSLGDDPSNLEWLLTCRPGLSDESLEAPIYAFTAQLADESIDESQLSSIEDDRDVAAKEKYRGQSDKREQLSPGICGVVLHVGETEDSVPLRVYRGGRSHRCRVAS